MHAVHLGLDDPRHDIGLERRTDLRGADCDDGLRADAGDVDPQFLDQRVRVRGLGCADEEGAADGLREEH